MKKTLSLFNISTIISFPFVLSGVRETNTYLKCICDIWLSWKQMHSPIKPTKCIHYKILFKTGLKWPIASICWTPGSDKLHNLGGGLCNFFFVLLFRSLSSFWLLYQQQLLVGNGAASFRVGLITSRLYQRFWTRFRGGKLFLSQHSDSGFPFPWKAGLAST